MAKKHFFSAHNDFKTGFFCKVFLIIGCILFIIYLIETLLHPIGLSDDGIGTILAFAILGLGFGLILYFFSRQFTKLSQIAEEIEQNESLVDEEETKEQV
jgi:Zn-dependent protease with chaperone function